MSWLIAGAGLAALTVGVLAAAGVRRARLVRELDDMAVRVANGRAVRCDWGCVHTTLADAGRCHRDASEALALTLRHLRDGRHRL